MEWIKISEAAQLTKRPARTIRHKAVLGHFRAKKKGKEWYIDINSLREHGWLPQQEKPQPINKEENLNQKNITSNQHQATASNKKTRDIRRSLGVYQELLNYQRNNKESSEEIKNALIQLSIGYFEFDKKYKVFSYRSARQEVLKILVKLHINEEMSAHYTETIETIERVLAGIGGLIKKTEKRKDERYSGAESALKD